MVCAPGEDAQSQSLSLQVAHCPLALAAGEGAWVQQRVPAGSSVGFVRGCECDQGGFDCHNPPSCSLGMAQATHMLLSSPSVSGAASY